jgi:uncharacterized protein (DUF1778 family)
MSEKEKQKVEEQIDIKLDKETWNMIQRATESTGKTPVEVIDESVKTLARKYGVKL